MKWAYVPAAFIAGVVAFFVARAGAPAPLMRDQVLSFANELSWVLHVAVAVCLALTGVVGLLNFVGVVLRIFARVSAEETGDPVPARGGDA